MRAIVLALLIAGTAAPALAQADPGWQRRRNEAEIDRQAELQRTRQAQREAEARRQRARTDATLRAIRAGELAGGPSVAWTPYRPSEMEPLPPRRSTMEAPAPVLTGDAARADDLMAAAMARSTARVKAIAPGARR